MKKKQIQCQNKGRCDILSQPTVTVSPTRIKTISVWYSTVCRDRGSFHSLQQNQSRFDVVMVDFRLNSRCCKLDGASCLLFMFNVMQHMTGVIIVRFDGRIL